MQGLTSRRWIGPVLVLTLLALRPSAASAQASITGLVRDASGAVLPGVTVEASSPALIEKVRVAATDGTGQYRIIDLRPGTYTVIFTLPGFSTVRQENIELTGSITASVNAELRVGALEETITVTAEAAVVDVQSVTQQRVLPREIISAIPTGRTHTTVAILIPGITGIRDVGGQSTLTTQGAMAIHGGQSGDSRVMVDGMTTQNSESTGSLSNHMSDMGGTQELTVDYAGGTADQPFAGIRINIIPREGGNRFSGSFYGTYANDKFEGNNYSQELQDRGLATPNSLRRVYDFNPNLGGPIQRDRLWFFAGARWVENNTFLAGLFYNLHAGDPNAWTYEPDVSRQAWTRISQRTVNGRVTWQAAQKHKIAAYYDNQGRCYCNWNTGHAGANIVSPEAMSRLVWPKNRFLTTSWSSPLSNRLLLEARFGNRHETYDYPNVMPDGDPGYSLVQVIDQGLGNLAYRAMGGHSNTNRPFQETASKISQVSASMAYVTGAHSFKFGFSDAWVDRKSKAGSADRQTYPYAFRFNNGVPNQITQFAIPYNNQTKQRAELGLYAQDRWTLDRLTLNVGVRFDWYSSYFPEQTLGAGPLIPNRNITFPETEGLNFKDVTPRFGVAYDLFGNGKTALKATVGRYPRAVGIGQQLLGEDANPAIRVSRVTSRSWNDADSDYVPDCDLVTLQANGECGRVADLNFGLPIPSTNLDSRVTTGWHTRPYQWEFSAGIQQQVVDRVSMNFGYFRRVYGNFAVTDNLLVESSDYSPFSITAPLHPRLPDGGGYLIDDLYDLNPDRVGFVSNLYRPAGDFGKQVQHWNGVDVTLDARLQGVTVQGGLSTGRTTNDGCDVVVDNPSRQYCRTVEKFLTQVKFLTAYTVPRVDVQLSATFQSLPGPAIAANYNAPNALVQPSLGRPLSGGASNISINLVEPGTMFGERSNQLDLRFSKIFRLDRLRPVVNLDIYNATNANPVISQNNAFAAWQRPTAILSARLLKLSAQIDF
jgi:hypothetical protein